MNEPLISVIIPAHNNEAAIVRAIDSILAQTYPHIEILVIDDNSTDNTAGIAKKYTDSRQNVRFYPLPHDDPHRVNKRGRNVNAGYMARNFGLDKAKGEWITFQDADDASLRNRIETEYVLARRFNALHVCLQWQQLTANKLGKTFDFEKALQEEQDLIITSRDINRQARATKGVAMVLLGPLRKYVPFEVKTMRLINKFFFGSLDSYPGSGNSPLFKKEVADRVRFRNVDERIWPSFTGRGADRDFNFQVAETFGKSVCFKLPLYLWGVQRENEFGYDFSKYLVE